MWSQYLQQFCCFIKAERGFFFPFFPTNGQLASRLDCASIFFLPFRVSYFLQFTVTRRSPPESHEMRFFSSLAYHKQIPFSQMKSLYIFFRYDNHTDDYWFHPDLLHIGSLATVRSSTSLLVNQSP